MDLNLTNTLFLFGILQCLIMVVLIVWLRKWNQPSNLILLAILLVLGISIMPYFIGNSKLILQYDYLRFAPLHLNLFVFPFLYLYLKSVWEPYFRLTQKASIHLVIPLLFWFYYFFIWIGTLFHEVEGKAVIAKQLGYFQFQQVHNFILLAMLTGYSWLGYRLIKKEQKDRLSKKEFQLNQLLWGLLIVLFVGAFLELIATLIGQFYGYWNSNPIDEWLGFSFTMMTKIYNAIVLYFIALVGFSSYSKLTPRRLNEVAKLANKLIPRLKAIMETKQLYKNHNLSLNKLAKELGTTSGNLSNVLNNSLHISFNDFVNQYRVEAVKNKLQSGQFKHLTLLAIAQEAGFKSKTTFYRAFQKFTAQTPKSFVDGLNAPK